MNRLLCKAIFATGVLLSAPSAFAQAYPQKQVDLIIPYSTGNGLDLLGREFAHMLEAELNVPVVVLNREGAAGVIGTSFVARAKPDGYTLLFHANPPFVTSSLTVQPQPYNPQKDFDAIAQVGSVPLVLITSSNSPFTDFKGMVEYMAANPDKSNYASAGVGSPGHIYGELLNRAMGVSAQEIRYKATGQALIDVVSGEVLISLVSVTAAIPHIDAGRLRVLAVGSSERLKSMPNVPTLAEALNKPGVQAGVWYGFFAPAGTPPQNQQRLFDAIANVAKQPRMLSFMERQNMTPHLQNPKAFANIIADDLGAASELLQSANLKQE